jgi:tetratricopeptide (TPR) repeat protein
MLASIAGAHGSKKRGIQTLERVAKEGQWTREEAKILLIAIYKKEKRFPDALDLSRELQEKYPRNYLFRLETADTLVSQAAIARQASKTKEAEAMEREALSTFETMLHDRPAEGAAPRALDLIHFRYGESLLLMGQAQRAGREFLAATIVNGAETGTVSRAHLRAAQAFDLAGNRKEALAEYRVVLSRPNVYDSYDQARRGQKEPYKEQPRSKHKLHN